MTMQAEAKSSTSSQLIFLTTLTIPRNTLANVCMASIQRSLRKQITWKIRFITASISSIILAKKSRMMSNNFSKVSHVQHATFEKKSTNCCDAFDIRFFMFEIVSWILCSFTQLRFSALRFTFSEFHAPYAFREQFNFFFSFWFTDKFAKRIIACSIFRFFSLSLSLSLSLSRTFAIVNLLPTWCFFLLLLLKN